MTYPRFGEVPSSIYNLCTMSATSTIQKLRAECADLRKALADALVHAEESGTLRKSKAVSILKTYPLAEAAVIEELTARDEAKNRKRFSVSKAAMASVSKAEATMRTGLPSGIASPRNRKG
jgi:hypothetical protein